MSEACISPAMDQTQLKVEFFELIRLLNKSNLRANQKTEISFFIERKKNKMVLFATTNKNYILQLIIKNEGQTWDVCGFSGLYLLEKRLSDFFNSNKLENLKAFILTQKIKLFIFQ